MYYLFYDGQQLQLIESELGAWLTTRLLLHAQVSAVDSEFYKVYGCFEDNEVTWLTEHKPRVQPVGFYVEPGTFIKDKDGTYWSLLSKADAAALLKHWKSIRQYTEKIEDKPNYFKNSVDHFENMMEKKWSKQTK